MLSRQQVGANALHQGATRWVLLIVISMAPSACHYGTYTTRVIDGQTVRGRAVDQAAYAEYLSGIMLETQGEWEAAYDTYRRALSHDPRSPEIWTRLGVVACHSEDQQRAKDAFEEAIDFDPTYSPAWLAKGECEMRHGHVEAALAAGVRAAGLDPASVGATELVASALEHQGKHAEAMAWLRGLVSYVPNDAMAWRALRRAAISAGDATDEARARRALARIRANQTETMAPEETPQLAELDVALANGNLDGARAFATDLRLPPAYVGLRAAALGEYDLADEQARLVWRADPNNTDAWITLNVVREAQSRGAANTAANAARTSAAFGQPPTQAPSPLAVRLFASLLARRLGTQAAKSWLAAAGPLPQPRDSVERGLESAWTPSQ